ncbi:phosphotransferase family protein [Brachybacterium hainanense]|uniref:Phosphotransferase family protein n=1 Tax=Brachybacterium hainanense TaxID=1541174 RepID=A0ABV6RCN9_9MICO
MTPEDLALLQALDPALPGIALLADAETVLDIGYLRWKPGTSLVAGVLTPLGPGFLLCAAPPARAKVDKLVSRAPEGGVLRHDPGRRAVLARPAADRDLPGLRRLPGEATQVLAYKPQRRWVGRVAEPGSSPAGPVLRLYRKGLLPGTAARWPGPEDAPFRIPRVLDLDARRSCMATEHLSGRPLLDAAVDAAERREAMRALGEALARWHARPAPARAATGRTGIVAAHRQLLRLLPDEHRRLARLAARLEHLERSRTDEGRVVWCHGDLSADQVLLGNERAPGIALLDWDRSGAGSPARDLAEADAAGLDDGGDGPGLPEPLRAALLEGYERRAPLPRGLSAARARACFVRAAEPFRRALPGWPALMRARLDRTETLLEELR